MALLHLSLAQIKLTDLQQLVRDGVRESREIDYKRDWKMVNEADRREFLFDVASFANAGGGDLVYGVTESDGVPTEVIGLEDFAQDLEQTRAEETLARGIEPRLAGVSFASIPLANKRIVFIVRVARSWTAPHMVTHSGVNRFYSRHSSGKFQLNVEQLRSSFLQSDRAGDRIRDFRLERVSRISTGDTGLTMWSKSALVLHVIPLNAPAGFDLRRVAAMQALPRPMGDISGYTPHMILDGLLIRSTVEKSVVHSYALVFRDGAIEAVMSHPGVEANRLIYPSYEGTLRKALIEYLKFYTQIGVTPPYFVGMTLVGVDGCTMASNDPLGSFRNTTVSIKGPNLLLPMVAADNDAKSADELLKPAFDIVWNACGYFGSPNYDEHGCWRKSMG